MAFVWSVAFWGLVVWLACGMWMVLSSQAGFEIETEGDEPCPLYITLAADLLAVCMAPWWVIKDRINGTPWD